MNLELLNAVASMTTAAIVGATAVAAIVQLRHLRSSNQINAQLAVRGIMNEIRRDSDLVRNGITQAMADPSFRRYVAAIARGKTCDHTPEQQALYNGASIVMGTASTIGELVRHGIIDEDLLLAVNHERFCATWRIMESYVALMREASENPNIWESWEYLAARSMEWGKLHPSWYPKDTPRLHPKNPWAGEDTQGDEPL